MDILELKERLSSLNAEAHDITASAESEKRDLSVEETENLDRILESFERVKGDIDRLEKLGAQTSLLNETSGRKTSPDQPRQLNAASGEDEDDIPKPKARRSERVPAEARDWVTTKTGGFRSLGHFGLSVYHACVDGGKMDPRLESLANATTFGSEGTGADGGFAVPPDFRTSIMETILGEDSILSRCDQITCSGNTFTQPVDETTPWQTTGGIQALWDGEATAANQSKPQLTERVVKLHKLRALVPMTEELLEDASAMDSYLRKKAPEKISFKMNFALVQGTGAGMPLGVLNSPAKIAVAKNGGQVNNTLVATNIQKMYNRMYGPLRSRAVWLVNQEVEPELYKMSLPGTDNTGTAVTTWGVWGANYLPPGSLSSTPYATLMGRPIIPTQACNQLGFEGDIIFADFNEYLALLKSGPNPRLDISMHLWFDQDLTAFKFVLRAGGVPWWSAPAQPRAGSNTYSPFITLADRHA